MLETKRKLTTNNSSYEFTLEGLTYCWGEEGHSYPPEKIVWESFKQGKGRKRTQFYFSTKKGSNYLLLKNGYRYYVTDTMYEDKAPRTLFVTEIKNTELFEAAVLPIIESFVEIE